MESAAPPPGVAVNLGEHQPSQADAGVELLGRPHGVLSGHGVDDQQGLSRGDGLLHGFQLIHQLVVDLEPARGVDYGPSCVRPLRPRDAVPGDLDGLRRGVFRVDLYVDLRAQDLELLDGGRALEVGGDQQRKLARLLQVAGHLRGGGRLA